MRRWEDEKRWMTLNLEPWTLKIDPRLSSFCYKDGLRPICLRHYPGLRPPLLKEGELRFAAPFSRGQQSQTTKRYCLVSGFRFQVSNLFISSSPHLFISSSSHRLIASSSHRIIVFHRLIASSLHRLIVSSFFIASSFFIVSSPHRLIVKKGRRSLSALTVVNC